MARAGIAGMAEELARLREAMAGRSPPYERALALLPAILAGTPGRLVEAAWESRRFLAWYDRPLLLLASLRNDALASGPVHPLHAGFGAPDPDPDAVDGPRLAASLDASRGTVFETLARRGVQTNETSRAVAWLWPAALAGASGGARAIALADVGASAGLNLVADALPPMWRAGDGTPLEVARDVRAVARLGLDPSPLDALRDDDARWLRALVWPGEREREARLDAALEAFRAARVRPDAPVLVPIAASNIPARLDLLSAADPGALVIAYQTVVRDYLEAAERSEYEQGMRDWLASRAPAQALWVELEPVPDGGEPAGTLVAHVRAPGGGVRSLELARSGVHPVRLDLRHDAVAELTALLRREPAAAASPLTPR